MAPTNTGQELIAAFFGRLCGPERTALDAAVQASTAGGWPLYLVGGAVRDLLLGRPHMDVDLAVDASPRLLLAALATRIEFLATEHTAFETVALKGSDWTIDVARTRRERYDYPGALPEVSPAPIHEDLGRRDFTVHAVALALAGPEAGALLDPFGGREDIAARTLRVLHDASFRDDPTRVLRLAHYQARLAFTVASRTRELARRDAAYLEAISPARIGHELERIFQEQRPEDSLFCLRDLHALGRIEPRLEVRAELRDCCARLRGDGGPVPGTAEYLALLVAGWDRGRIQRLIDRTALERAPAAVLRAVPRVARDLAEAASCSDPAEIVTRFEQVPLGALRGAAAVAGGARYDLVRRYLAEWMHLRPALRGDDVLALGVPPGPRVGEILEALRAAHLRGEVQTVDDERALVARLAAPAGTPKPGANE